MKKYIRLMIAVTALFCVMSVFCAAEFDSYMYNRNGNSKYVYSWSHAEELALSGDWSSAKPITMYSADGRTYGVFPHEIELYKKSGWYTEPVSYIDVYSFDGRRLTIVSAELDNYKAVGWYEASEVSTTMYAPDGRTQSVFNWEVEANKAVGWYTEPVTQLYAPDGRTIVVFKSEVEAYKAVGWYEAIVLSNPNGSIITVSPFDNETITSYKNAGWHENYTVYSADGRSASVPVYELNLYLKSGWFQGVKMYSDDGRTISVSPWQVEEYKAVGWHAAFDIDRIESGKLYIDINEPSVIKDGLYVRYLDVNGNIINSGKWDYEYVRRYSYSDYSAITDCPSNAVGLYITTESYDVDLNTVAYDNVYYYCNYVTMYSDDGKSIRVPELQVAEYEKIGWHMPVTMYSLDGRTVVVPHYDVKAYESVGWYQYSDWYFESIIRPTYNDYINNGKYGKVLDLIEVMLPNYYGSKHEQTMYDMKTTALDKWRKQAGRPLAVGGDYIKENSIGTPQAKIYFTNVSHKRIVAFKVKFTCYNIFGELEKTYYDYYYTDDANLNSGEGKWYTWTLYGADSVKTIKNIKVTEIVYSDGTKWKA